MLKAKKMMSRAIGVMTAALMFSSASAQEDIFSFGMQLGVGARAIAMGGAYTALGGDYSASLWNPAALADIRRVEVYSTLSYLSRGNEFSLSPSTAFSNSLSKSDKNFTDLSTFGIAYPVPTYRGSLVFSFGYNRVKSLDSNFEFVSFNQTSDDLVNQAWREIEKGSLNAWILAGAMDISRSTSLGIGLNFWTGGSNFQTTFREVDSDDNYEFNDYTQDNILNTDISGFNVKLGMIHRFGDFMRLGITAASPTTFKVKEGWEINDVLNNDDGSNDFFNDQGNFTYKIKSPWTFNTGASIKLLNILVSGDLEFVDWSEVRYTTEPPVEGLTKVEANRIFADQYGQTTNVDLGKLGIDFLDTNFNVPTPRVRLGAEFTIPLTDLSFRAGYFRDPSVFKDALSEENKQFYSAGFGLLLDKSVKLDLAYVYGFWKSFNSGLPETDDVGSYVEDIEVNKIFVSLAFRF